MPLEARIIIITNIPKVKIMEQAEKGKPFNYYLGQCQKPVENSLEELNSSGISDRIWKKDFTVWSNKPVEITNRLGWLNSPDLSLSLADEIISFVQSVIKDGFTQALLLGMGGSSLAPEVFHFSFGVKEGYLNLEVLDSTHPETVLDYSKRYDPAKTLYIVSTKSGGTVETFSFMKYFYNLTIEKLGKENTGRHFVAITDPGSGLESIAQKLNFRKIFLNDPNIGGRYSALSLFGIVPAALMGVDIVKLLNSARTESNQSKDTDVNNNASAVLGVILGELSNLGKDKVTFITSLKLSYFGGWVEQLIAESTGKSGKGILPVIGEEILSPEKYSDDRLFVYLHLLNDNNNEAKVKSIIDAGRPVVEIILNDIYDLGREFFRWEIATAIASWRIGITPFDQPNVESAKILARKMVQEYKENGKLPELVPTVKEDDITVYGSETAESIESSLNNLFTKINEKDTSKPRSYVSLQAYLARDKKIDEELQNFRTAIQVKYKVAVTVGYGPRFLHSTGQLHKGDAGNGIFIQFLSNSKKDAAIPDEAGEKLSSISFGVLIKSQALGDRQALIDGKRNIITIDLGNEPVKALQKLTQFEE
jgi:glucose-6-phosphate isomerase